jgi:GTPase SAR1 family protein
LGWTQWAGSSLVILVYDVTNRASFDALPGWLAEVQKCLPKKSGGKDAVVGVLVAAKCDQSDFAVVAPAEAVSFATKHGLAFFETAAASAKDTDNPFNFLAAKFHEYYEAKLKDVVESID